MNLTAEDRQYLVDVLLEKLHNVDETIIGQVYTVEEGISALENNKDFQVLRKLHKGKAENRKDLFLSRILDGLPLSVKALKYVRLTPQIIYMLGLAVEAGCNEEDQRHSFGDDTVDWIKHAGEFIHLDGDKAKWINN